jgi:hypothetical protein
MHSKTFSNETLDAITIDRAPMVFFRYDQSKPRMIHAILPCKHNESLVDRPFVFTKNPTIFVGFSQSLSAGKLPLG